MTIQSKRGRKGKWRNAGTASVNGVGYFNRRIRGSSSAQYRYVYGSTRSRAAGVAR